MTSFLISLVVLALGYLLYGRFVQNVFGPDDRKTPCFTKQDGIDYIPMPAWKVYMIQFLNIAGVGPIFGAIMGAQFGTASYIWIVLGTIFAGATHDYLAAMMSMRHEGESLPELIGRYLGKRTRVAMSVFSILLMILVGAVFTSSPANILGGMTREWFTADQQWINQYGWICLIFAYYVIATLCPVDKIIGKVYPFFAFCLIFMAVGIMTYILVCQPALPEWWDVNYTDARGVTHASALVNGEWSSNPIFPMMFISIACGAISGFHATQSPMMARCIQHERMGRPCFYGAMVTEGVVALVWAAAATCFFGEHGLVNEATGKGYDGGTVATLISQNWLGTVGGILAIIGVAVAPITSGDTALRSGRLIVADFLHMEQKTMRSRLLISVPMFIITAAILVWSMNDANGFGMLWRYFGWANQTLSVFTLWAITVYLKRHKGGYWYVITWIPAMLMTTVCTSFILMLQQGGFGLPYGVSVAGGVVVALVLAGMLGRK